MCFISFYTPKYMFSFLLLCPNILRLVSIFESYLRENFRISESPLRHPIPAYLTLARLNGLDDDGYREAIHAQGSPDLVISGI